jgi:DNA-binding winged helix-turn-helix (wHTH) protein
MANWRTSQIWKRQCCIPSGHISVNLQNARATTYHHVCDADVSQPVSILRKAINSVGEPSLKSARTRPREGVRVRLHTATCQHEMSDVHRRCIPECVSKYTAQIEGQYQLCQTEQTLHRKTPKGSPADSASADSPTSFPSQQEYRRHSFPPFFLSLSLFHPPRCASCSPVLSGPVRLRR